MRSDRGAIGILLLIVFLDMLAFGIIIPFTPFWAERYGANPFMVTLLFSTYSLFAFLMGRRNLNISFFLFNCISVIELDEILKMLTLSFVSCSSCQGNER